ncbi:hypothetical protein TNCV_1010301 [Trichonephila clavipes]|nr:hypothetical protein TNCV_1010301 [Trichonephila clavipes]
MSNERFTNTKLADMHLIYGLAEGNARSAGRLQHERYPQRDVSDRLMFEICITTCVNMDYYEAIGRERVIRDWNSNMVQGFFRTISTTFCSMKETKCVGYRGPPSLCLLPRNDPYSHKL